MTSLNLYFDDTGSRHPDKKSDPSRQGRDWFALGGILIKQEDEETAKMLHAGMAQKWSIRSPFHITDMLSERKGFAWLGRLTAEQRELFWSDYRKFLVDIPAIGMACVIDRPGYAARGYVERYGSNKWLLCRSAFDILVERSAKVAKREGRRLKVIFEGDRAINDTIKEYFKNLKANGLAFDEGTSGRYNPLPKDEFQKTLTTIEYKDKQSILLQIADSYVYAMARNGYDKKFDIYRRLRDSRRIANFALPQDAVYEMGVKYYCFDRQPQNT
jgi:Protein of unknown function (DUF3800)